MALDHRSLQNLSLEADGHASQSDRLARGRDLLAQRLVQLRSVGGAGADASLEAQSGVAKGRDHAAGDGENVSSGEGAPFALDEVVLGLELRGRCRHLAHEIELEMMEGLGHPAFLAGPPPFQLVDPTMRILELQAEQLELSLTESFVVFRSVAQIHDVLLEIRAIDLTV
jgi:hypothetical protein